jgi:hypothetical protein
MPIRRDRSQASAILVRASELLLLQQSDLDTVAADSSLDTLFARGRTAEIHCLRLALRYDGHSYADD